MQAGELTDSKHLVNCWFVSSRRKQHCQLSTSVWNSLPADIQHITDISKFKRHLKTDLFNLYFNT